MRPPRLSRRRSASILFVCALSSSPVGLACSLLTDLSGLTDGRPSGGGAGESGAPTDAAGGEDSSGRDADSAVTLDGGANGDAALGACAIRANTLYCEDFDREFTVSTPPMNFAGSCSLSSAHATSAPNALHMVMSTGQHCYRDPVALPPGTTNLRATTRLWFDAIQGRVHMLDFVSRSGLQERLLYVNFRPNLVEFVAYTGLPDGGQGSYLGLASRGYTTPLGRWIDAEFRVEGLDATPAMSLIIDGIEVISKTAAPDWTNATNLQFVMGVSFVDAPATVFFDDVRVDRF